MEPSDFSITQMKLSDLEEIQDILIRDFDDFWNVPIWKSELENPNSIYFVLKKNNEIIGLAGILVVMEQADITNIVVKKSFRRKRIFSFVDGIFDSLLSKKGITKNES